MYFNDQNIREKLFYKYNKLFCSCIENFSLIPSNTSLLNFELKKVLILKFEENFYVLNIFLFKSF